MMAKFNAKSKAIGCLALLLIGLLSLTLGFAYATGYLPQRLFESSDWRLVGNEHHRVKMVEHLLWSGKLDGLTQAEVVELLGPETQTTYFSEFDSVYWLGPERGILKLDSAWLVIDFDESGVVSNYKIVED